MVRTQEEGGGRTRKSALPRVDRVRLPPPLVSHYPWPCSLSLSFNAVGVFDLFAAASEEDQLGSLFFCISLLNEFFGRFDLIISVLVFIRLEW